MGSLNNTDSTSCTLERRGRVFILRLTSANPNDEHRLTPRLLSDILAALDAVDSHPDAAALITASHGKFFTNGLHLSWANQKRSSRLPKLLALFERVALRLLNLGIPTIAAVQGHAAGAGFLLAMAHDYRFMRSDRGFLYCAAVDAGVALPEGSVTLLREKMGGRALRDAVLRGEKYTATRAEGLGLVDWKGEGEEGVLEAALAEAEVLVGREWERGVYRALRKGMYGEAMDKLEEGVAMAKAKVVGKIGEDDDDDDDL
ncbi:hypothetical protein AMTRI_Chr01g113080 [Amborella trichopoda]|uniref:Delta(3)-Delta(2)-enoyl-CoA isomerase n=1 Tax=Amborella trichopoda TaxID=13333 RepID=W1PXT7_AMBTC|nr:enoyl-CoA delta isomerase 2, peroxisomal [Amborella trichopoda]ERN12696.1 hypothetical protein AMTR_s00025p00249370 [Amborella trichopoda]|eukprot:XP_011625815.1 enoyl-CoA delta isomerase 2, peroxisomal [Amborella trichopoda]